LRFCVNAGFILGLMIAGGCEAAPGEDPSGTFQIEEIASFDRPWALTFLPDGRMLVTEKPGSLLLVSADGDKLEVAGVPEVDFGGQGGLGDVVLHPDYSENSMVYLSYVEAAGAAQGEEDTRGAVVVRGRLELTERGAALEDLEVIWRQTPKVTGRGHFGHRLLFDDNGYLFISSGERQKFTPAQDMAQNLGKIIRLHDDGSIPADNPFAESGGVAAQVWTLGQRNPLGLAFDADGQLWEIEMGPAGGDELNLIVAGSNYGYPVVSNGDHYNGDDIPDHHTRPEFVAPEVWWTPVISPGGLMIYSGELFPDWQGDAFAAGLSSKSLVRINLEGEPAEVQRFAMGERIRAVVQGPQGAIYLLEDGKDGRLLKLLPAA